MTSTGVPAQLLTCIEGALETVVVERISNSSHLEVARRCVDLPEMLGAAAAGRGSVVLLSAFVVGLDRVTIEELRRYGVVPVGVYDATDVAAADQARARFEALQVRHTVAMADESTVETLEAAVVEATGASAPTVVDPASEAMWRELESTPEEMPEVSEAPRRPGTLIAVWGPVGGPGATTIAVQLAARLARSDRRVLLVDADTYGACTSQLLGLVDEAPGVAAACRLAHNGNLTVGSLAALAPTVIPKLHVLTGIPRADRWQELTDVGLQSLWEVAVQFADVTIVDAGFCLESDEADTFAPRRHAATLSALEHADAVVAVGSADPVGLARLVRGVSQVRDVSGAPVVAVANRLRRQVTGARAEPQISELLAELVDAVVTIEDDPTATDTLFRLGGLALEHPLRGGLGQGINRLAKELMRTKALTPAPAATPDRPQERRVAWRGRRGRMRR